MGLFPLQVVSDADAVVQESLFIAVVLLLTIAVCLNPKTPVEGLHCQLTADFSSHGELCIQLSHALESSAASFLHFCW